jgi:hypothetical protein
VNVTLAADYETDAILTPDRRGPSRVPFGRRKTI